MPTPVADTLAPGTATPADPSRSRLTEALPVALRPGTHGDRLRGFLEGELGWQVVEADDADLPARVVVTTTSGRRTSDIPHLLVIDAEDPPSTVAEACLRIEPEAVAVWPDDRAALPSVVARLLERPVDTAPAAGATVLSVGGSAGGVGTTTVAVALAAARAWAGGSALALVRPPVGLDAPVHPPDVRASARLWASSVEVPGVVGARVACCLPGSDPVAVPGAETVVVDRGVDTDVDVLVIRPDRAGMASLAETVASVVVLNGPGPVPDQRAGAAVAGRRVVRLPWSARVARADHHGRGPAAYPGTWLRPLLPIARGPTG